MEIHSIMNHDRDLYRLLNRALYKAMSVINRPKMATSLSEAQKEFGNICQSIMNLKTAMAEAKCDISSKNLKISILKKELEEKSAIIKHMEFDLFDHEKELKEKNAIIKHMEFDLFAYENVSFSKRLKYLFTGRIY